MSGETDIEKLIKTMQPELSNEEYVFSTLTMDLSSILEMDPWAIIQENEGTTVIIDVEKAEKNHILSESIFKRITLKVHSSLNAVGLTAMVSVKLMELGISANVIAGYYHDHIFVQTEYAEKALIGLLELSKSSRGKINNS
ncbi:MAG: ACT domain-containing protein [Candidatus Vecturithrix sp.]|jgi:hypothetical protein|nr:ACT domain-containing protein [Candidatus Vecturithrix sp.]